MKTIAQYIGLLLAVCAVSAACRGQGPIVDTGDPLLRAKENRWFYNDQPFTGMIRTSIPVLNQVDLTAYRLGFQHGVSREETTAGKVLATRSYYAGMKHGIHETWDANGTLRSHAQFKHGKYTGEAWEWYANGVPYDFKKYNDNGEVVIARRWRPTGQIYMNQVFHNGVALGMPGSKLCNPSGSEAASR